MYTFRGVKPSSEGGALVIVYIGIKINNAKSCNIYKAIT